MRKLKKIQLNLAMLSSNSARLAASITSASAQLIRRCCTNPATIKPKATYWLLQYSYVNNALEKRVPIRSAHLAHVSKFTDTPNGPGPLILGGAFNNPLDGAAIVFKNVPKETVESFAKSDPYVTQGLVKNWIIREWTVVVGSLNL